jgi:predicted O-methyltransferase YrrM
MVWFGKTIVTRGYWSSVDNKRWEDELTAPAAEPDNAAELDNLAVTVLSQLCHAGLLPASEPRFPVDRFRELDALVREGFDVPHTTITALARRVLFGIAATVRPATTVVLGSFVGYAAVWLFGPALLREPLFQATRLIACDVFEPAVAQARENFAVFGGGMVDLRVQNAVQLLDEFSGMIDILYIDVDSEESGKRMYADLLRMAITRLAPGALVLAHDVTHPFYIKDVADYQKMVRDRRLFHMTATLEIDPCGLEVTLV